jgi:ketosteroid isomerase-like protein
MRAAAPICAAAVAVALLAGCGGDDKAEVQGVVRDFAKALNAHDGKAVCTRLASRAFVENTTFAKGDSAVRQCESQIRSLRQPRYRVVKFTRTEVHGDTASVTAELETDGQRRPQVFDLHKEDGSFRVTTGQAR